MESIILPHKRWQQIFNVQMIIALIVIIIVISQHGMQTTPHFIQLAILIALIGLNLWTQIKSKTNKVLLFVVRWLNLIIFTSGFVSIWLQVGNFLLLNFKQLEVLWILLLWAAYLVLLLPLAVLFAGKIKNWFLALIAVNFLGCQYGPDASLQVSTSLPWMHSITSQGVIAAFALFNIACFLPKAWGYNFNPNLKFIKSKQFQNLILVILLIFATIDLLYNDFSDYNSSIWSVFFKYSIGFEGKYFTIANFTSALEPAVLEETTRYLWILILLAGFNRFKKYRVPVAIFGSAILFGLLHAGNIGWHGETAQETIAQVIGVMGSGLIWAALYLYSGKLWLPMIFHFLTDYLGNLQSGWNSSSWSFSGTAADYLFEFLIIAIPLAEVIWMMFGKRREVLEENADRILNLKAKSTKYLLTHVR